MAAIVRRLSQLTNESQSAVVVGILESSEPILSRVIVALEAAEKARDQLPASVRDNLRQAQEALEAQLGFGLEEFDQATAPILAMAERIDRRARRSGPGRASATAAAALAPPSNRGVRNPGVGAVSAKRTTPANRGRGKP